VTEADRQSEHIITTVIENEFPKHGIRSEESPAIPAQNGFEWLIDPLDGTGTTPPSSAWSTTPNEGKGF
jgi:myo-inositol-1(or 4)-monophosphatase